MNQSLQTVITIALVVVAAASQTGTSRSPSPSPATALAPPQATKPAPRIDYVGDDACQSCHREKVEAFHRTAHSLTSRLPRKDSILGKFTPDANVMKTFNPNLFFRMEEKEGGFFQTAVEGADPYITSRTERFALVVGSGGKGQTYLYWKGDQLFQLPVSYWNQLGWVNSPGYRDGTANFNRPVIPRCLECHGTYFEALPPPPNRYKQSGFSVGITCEKCHGPGREHVERYQANPRPISDSVVLNPARFSRERQMDLCGWCHAGHGFPRGPAFSYVPGTPLEKSIQIPQPEPGAPLDVHGSQVELLRKSRCYQASEMTCLTCHDVHTAQHDLAVLSQRCLSCHKPESAVFAKPGHAVVSNCIDCHMPLQETELIVFNQSGKREKPRIRNHWIKVYSGTAPSGDAKH